LNGSNLIFLSNSDTKSDALAGFWRWIELLAHDDYQKALEALFWSKPTTFTPEKFKDRITHFFGGKDIWIPIVPNERLIKTVDDMAEFEPRNKEGWSWLRAHIPVTTSASNPKDDKIPLLGIAASFFIRQYKGGCVMEFEIFHL
jgi:hypothetical protein